jgi:quinohemoprotein ethanol dehydrogenase
LGNRRIDSPILPTLVDGGDVGERHFSAPKEITDKNVNNLGLAWWLDIDSPMGMAAEPIVIDGRIYVTDSLSRVYAVVLTG